MQQVDYILKKQVLQNKTPSVQYMIFNQDHIIHQFQSGYADLANQIVVDEHTTFNAFSVTKTFTALAILQLEEKGKINIDNNAYEYVEEFPYPLDISIKQLMAHTAGIPNPNPLSWIHLQEEHQGFDKKGFFDQIFQKYHKVKSKPNNAFAYSNLGYVLLGQIIASVAKISYEEYIRENILRPLGMSRKELGFEIVDENKHAKGYQKRLSLFNAGLFLFMNKSKFVEKPEGNWRPFKHYYVNGPSYGGLRGTPLGFYKYLQELLKPNCALISDQYKALMFEENLTNSNKSTGMCLAWFRGKLLNQEYVTHAGGGGGYYCEVRIYPRKNIGSLIMYNRTGMNDRRVLDKLDKYFLK